MKHKVSELEGALLDVWVAKAEGWRLQPDGVWLQPDGQPSRHGPWSTSTVWKHGGPIIERERIRLTDPDPTEDARGWVAMIYRPVHKGGDGAVASGTGPTPLIAAMRAYVASKFGDEVELP